MTKYERVYTFHVKGIAIIHYERPDRRNVVTVDYKRTYKFNDRHQRPDNDKLWTDFAWAIKGHPIVEHAWIDMLLCNNLEPGVQSIKANGWRVDIPYVYQFDGSQG